MDAILDFFNFELSKQFQRSANYASFDSFRIQNGGLGKKPHGGQTNARLEDKQQ